MTRERIYNVNIVLASGFLILSLLFGSAWFDFVVLSNWLFYLSIAILVLTVSSKRVGGIIAKGWMGFGMFLGNINAKIILTLMFFLLLMPLAFLKKMTTKKKAQGLHSNWVDVGKEKQVDFTKLW